MEQETDKIVENPLRIGRFTSSEIWRLMTTDKSGKGFGSQGLSYIKEKQWERKLGRSLKIEKTSRATLWGQFLEQRVHYLLPMGYEFLSHTTTEHNQYGDIWVGSQDNINRNESVMADTKCYEPKAFCEYVDNLLEAQKTGDLTTLKKDNAKEYWQLVSNACIWQMKYIEAIVYMPYLSELPTIRDMALKYDKADHLKFKFIYEVPDCELAYLIDSGYYKNLNCIRFECPQADKDLLTEKVVLAGTFLKL